MNNVYEKAGLLYRLKESGNLFIYMIASFLVSLIVMNILIFPIAIFAVEDQTAFTLIVKNLFWILFFCALGYLLVKKIIYYRKNEFPLSRITRNIILKPLSFIFFIILILIIIFSLIALINFILQKNYYLIYKIINY